MSTLLCVNSNSRSGDDDLDPYVEILSVLGPVIVHKLDEKNQLGDLLKKLEGQVDRIVIGGGDGTLNASLHDIRKAGFPLGVLPLGTANDFARSLGLPMDPQRAMAVVVEGHTSKIQLGEANGHLFLNAAGIGLGPKVSKSLNHERKQKLGVLAYMISLMQVLGKFSQPWRRRATLTLDGKTRKVRYLQITVANGIHYGGGLTIAQDAELNDGQLRVLCLTPQSFFQLLKKFFVLRWGANKAKPDKPGMSIFEAQSLSIKTWRRVDVTLDGELLTKTPLVCHCVPDAIEVFVPAE